jgi:FKBP-type peptidyl-prolyl cis-trans isomerase FklB
MLSAKATSGGHMKLIWLAGLGLGLLPVQLHAQEPAVLTEKDKMSYAIGVQVAESIKSQGVEVSPDLVARGILDTLAGAKLLLSDEQLGAAVQALQQDMRRRQELALTAMKDRNKRDGDAFLAENAKKEGVVSLPSGLQYKILTAAEGRKPTDDDTVVCHYRGTLINGTEFDSSYGADPATFAVGAVVQGFREAVKLMSVGSKWQFFIPSNLAYGERGAGNAIEPNSTLVFEIELISIQ